MRNILVSAISFVNPTKNGSEIYTTFAKRLINDVLTKTPYDIMITTNNIDNFSDVIGLNNSRVIIRHELLENHKTHVGVFNQLLKFNAIKDIDKKYDWVLYLDCDAGFTEKIDVNVLERLIDNWESRGHDMVALRTNATYVDSELQYLDGLSNKCSVFGGYLLPLFLSGKFFSCALNPLRSFEDMSYILSKMSRPKNLDNVALLLVDPW
jgi:hypothetical protein